jgi:hypothetical protein
LYKVENLFLKKNWLKKSFNHTSLGRIAQKAVQRNTIRPEKKNLLPISLPKSAFFSQLSAFSYPLLAFFSYQLSADNSSTINNRHPP